MSGDPGLVFLTGATGFIGRRLAVALNARGHRLRCLVRSPERAGALAALGAELIVGDTGSPTALEKCMRGVDLAYHVAGAYDIGVVDGAAMRRTNVDGTRAFVEAARHAAVRQSVYVSTTAVLAADDGDAPRLMSAPYPTVYQETKAAAHRLAEQAQQEGLPLVIACPAYVYGPGDTGPAGRYVRDLLHHRIPGLSTRPTTFSYVHVDDVVQGLLAAGERGTMGATYVLSGEAADVNDFTRRVVALAGTWGPPLRIPPTLVKLTGTMLDAVSRMSGVRLPISRELADLAATGARYVHPYTRAARELGYSARSLDEGLPETIADARRQ